jgi:branched-chain amino acid transport system permease protein
MAIAAYTMAILVVRLEVPLLVGVAGGVVAAVLLAFIVGIPSLRLRADYLAIATVAASEVVRYLAMNLPDLTGGPLGSIGLLGPGDVAMYNTEWLAFVGWLARITTIPRDGVVAVLVWSLALLLILALWDLQRSPWGRVLRAIREDEAAATAAGKNVFSFRMQALVVGAVLGAVAGMLLAWQIGVFAPDDYQPTLTFYAYLILILGGSNRIWAIPLGAVLFSLLYSGTRFLNFFPLSLFDSGARAFLRLFLVGFLLVLFMALRPQGILGNRRELLLEK